MWDSSLNSAINTDWSWQQATWTTGCRKQQIWFSLLIKVQRDANYAV